MTKRRANDLMAATLGSQVAEAALVLPLCS